MNLSYKNKGLNANPSLAVIDANKDTMVGFKVMLTNWLVQDTGGPKIDQPDAFGGDKSMKNSLPHSNNSNREFDTINILRLATFNHFNEGNH